MEGFHHVGVEAHPATAERELSCTPRSINSTPSAVINGNQRGAAFITYFAAEMDQLSGNYNQYPPLAQVQQHLQYAYPYPTPQQLPYPAYAGLKQPQAAQSQYYAPFPIGVPRQRQAQPISLQQTSAPPQQPLYSQAPPPHGPHRTNGIIPQAPLAPDVGVDVPTSPGAPPPDDLEDQLRTALEHDNAHPSASPHPPPIAGPDSDSHPHDHSNDDDDDAEGPIFHLPPPPEGNYPSAHALETSLHAFSLAHGYELVRRASKKNAAGAIYKRYYHCSKHGKLANTAKLTPATRVRTGRSTNRQNCPMSMAVVAADPANPAGEWQIRHRQTQHNHGPVAAVLLTGHRRRARLGRGEKAVDELFALGTRTSEVVAFLQRTQPEGLFTRTDVANMKLKYRKFGTCVHMKDQFARDEGRALDPARACLGCRGKKVRCSGVRPVCQVCLAEGGGCVYDHAAREGVEGPLGQEGRGDGEASSPIDLDAGDADIPRSGRPDAPRPPQQPPAPAPAHPPAAIAARPPARRARPRGPIPAIQGPTSTQQHLATTHAPQHPTPTPAHRLTLTSSSVEVLAHGACGSGETYVLLPTLTCAREWGTWSAWFGMASRREGTWETLTGAKGPPAVPAAAATGEGRGEAGEVASEMEVEVWNEYIRQTAIWRRRNEVLLGALHGALVAALRTRIQGCEVASEAWTVLEGICAPKGSGEAWGPFGGLMDVSLQGCGGDVQRYVGEMERAWGALGEVNKPPMGEATGALPAPAAPMGPAQPRPRARKPANASATAAATAISILSSSSPALTTPHPCASAPPALSPSPASTTGADLIPEATFCLLLLRGLGPEWKMWADELCAGATVGGLGTGVRVGWREVVRRVEERGRVVAAGEGGRGS
ncbi:hypothetical protein LTR53_005032 [Teratosphaeriaceae sp. CCFEE 6253]|nr:hypothetical protein LTR53_005032 [Teratosphaeriaceae sp. CCFEE 6253]